MINKKTVSEKLAEGFYKNPLPYARRDKAANLAWREAENEKVDQFRRDLAEEHGLLGHPKEPELWRLAWSHGHANGLSDVMSYYADFSALLDPQVPQ